jgi:hypothetical protein
MDKERHPVAVAELVMRFVDSIDGHVVLAREMDRRDYPIVAWDEAEFGRDLRRDISDESELHMDAVLEEGKAGVQSFGVGRNSFGDHAKADVKCMASLEHLPGKPFVMREGLCDDNKPEIASIADIQDIQHQPDMVTRVAVLADSRVADAFSFRPTKRLFQDIFLELLPDRQPVIDVPFSVCLARIAGDTLVNASPARVYGRPAARALILSAYPQTDRLL